MRRAALRTHSEQHVAGAVKREKRKKNKWKYIQNELRTVVIFSSVCLQGQLLRWLETGTGFADCWSEFWDWHYFRFEHRLFLSFSLPVLFWFLSRDCCFRILVVVWSCCIFCASVVETGTGSGSQCSSYAPFMCCSVASSARIFADRKFLCLL